MSGVLDRQEIIAVLDLHLVGQQRMPAWDSYRERIADALMALVVYPVSVQVRCTDSEDYARIHNEGYATAVEQFGEMLTEVRSDLRPRANAKQVLGWLDDAVKAMGGPR